MLQTAMVLIRERGIYGTRVEDITDRCDVGKGVFYNYFESKDALVAELLDQGVRLLEERYLDASAVVPDFGARIAGLVRQHETFFLEHPEYTLLFHQARGMMLLDRRGEPRLQKAFRGYLLRLGARISPPSAPEAAGDPALLDAAAALAGAVIGNHTFRLAAGLAPSSEPVIGMVSAGLSEVLRIARGTSKSD